MKPQPQKTPLHDGAVSIYRIGDPSQNGDMPAKTLTLLGTLHYHRRTIGIQRAYLALQSNAKIDLLLRCPYREEVKAKDIAVPTLDGKQYKIMMVQVPEDIKPTMMDLTLERLETDYDLP